MKSSTTQTRPFLSDTTYTRMKWVAQILLPALGTLYFSLAGIWGLPKAEEVVGTIMAVDLFLGLVLGISTNQYNKSDAKYDGAINVLHTQDTKQVSLDLDGDPHEVLEEKPELLFKVNNEVDPQI